MRKEEFDDISPSVMFSSLPQCQRASVSDIFRDGKKGNEVQGKSRHAACWGAQFLIFLLGVLWIRTWCSSGSWRLFHKHVSFRRTHSSAFPQDICHVYGTAYESVLPQGTFGECALLQSTFPQMCPPAVLNVPSRKTSLDTSLPGGHICLREDTFVENVLSCTFVH